MRILVVDDDAITRFLIISMLEQQGYLDVFEVDNGIQALELAKSINPDLVLLDVVMPELDGYQVASALKESAGDIYLPIIFITALEDESSLVKCLEAGGDDFVSKPFNKVILGAKIRAHSRTRLLSKKSDEQNKQLSYYRNDVEREHKIVEHIFTNALCVDPSFAPYLDFCINPAADFNGDLFLANKSPTGGLYFLIGDFTGHGLASAIGALPVSQVFQKMSNKGLSIMEMAETINGNLLDLLPDDMFFAAAIVEISQSGDQIDVWNGGMPNLIVQNADGNIEKRFESRHMALGILEPHEFESKVDRYVMHSGDRLVAFSDGVIEIENDQNIMLTETGFESWLIEEPSSTVDGLVNKVTNYLGSNSRNDDITMVIFKSQPLHLAYTKDFASKIPFKIAIKLDAKQIKNSDPIVDLVSVITNQLALYGIHSELFTVLTELYSNAIEHGVLELDSTLKHTEEGFSEYFVQREDKLAALQKAKIIIIIEYRPEKNVLAIRIKDSGKGFNQQNDSSLEKIEQSYGRGILLVKELCESIKYSHQGNTVDVVFKI